MLEKILDNMLKESKREVKIFAVIAAIITFISCEVGATFIGIVLGIFAVILWGTCIFSWILSDIITNKVWDDFTYMKRSEFLEKYEEYLEEE